MTDCSASELIDSRRRTLLVSGTCALSVLPIALHASPQAMKAAMREVFQDRAINDGRVTLSIPALAENGNSVPMTVAVDSPMTGNDYVKSIHIFSEKNPLPNIAAFYLGPYSGRAKISTRIRLSNTQIITAVAAMHDGSLWSATAETVVTLAACIDEGL